jgi:hypothetical protein
VISLSIPQNLLSSKHLDDLWAGRQKKEGREKLVSVTGAE